MIDMEQRIADIIAGHDCWDYAGALSCRCGDEFDGGGSAEVAVQKWAAHVAAALVAELGLAEEEDADFAFGGLIRYATPWVAVP